ncbi:hypothetical protein MTR_7g033930 [Medicago truncatula]|uniref:Uncharacterized protein n=1 Tax=Medicago truncatula TaxID=3880 RepID=A0A072TY97_MEDTR|nr:hypothetical protein MTR_7g033930 [Medicago truncatula]
MMNKQALEDNIMEVKEYCMLSTVGTNQEDVHGKGLGLLLKDNINVDLFQGSICFLLRVGSSMKFAIDITMRYVKLWKQSMLGHGDFVKKIVKQKRSLSSRKCKTRVGKANKNGIYVCGQPGFRPHLEDTPSFRIFSSSDVTAENDAHDCEKSEENIDAFSHIY